MRDSAKVTIGPTAHNRRYVKERTPRDSSRNTEKAYQIAAAAASVKSKKWNKSDRYRSRGGDTAKGGSDLFAKTCKNSTRLLETPVGLL